jgi:lipooligosaccharide transport system ATP-binding protein
LEELRAGGLTILLTTHYMEEASRLCDRLIIMDHGRILIEGTPADLIRQHAGRDVIEVSEPTDQLRSFITSKGLPHDDLGHRLIIYCDDRDRLYTEVSSQFCREGCIMRMATLEDVFLKLTGRELRE